MSLLGVAVLIASPEGILVSRRKPHVKSFPGRWQFPGGGVEPHEKPAEAAIREVAEETGLALDPGELLFLTSCKGTKAEGDYTVRLYLVERSEPILHLVKNLEPDKCEGWMCAPPRWILDNSGLCIPGMLSATAIYMEIDR